MSYIIYPSRSPAIRSTASLHRVPWGGFPDFNGTISELRLLALHPASLRFLRSALPPRGLGSLPRLETYNRGPGPFIPRLPHAALLRWRTRGLPGSRATLVYMPRSSTPVDRLHQAVAIQPMLPSAKTTTSAPLQSRFRGSITRPTDSLCTLRSRGRPRTTQHSVPAGGQPLPGQGFHLLGRKEGFRHVCPLTWLPPSPSFAWRNVYSGLIPAR